MISYLVLIFLSVLHFLLILVHSPYRLGLQYHPYLMEQEKCMSDPAKVTVDNYTRLLYQFNKPNNLLIKGLVLNGSKSSICSPVPMKIIGLFVAATLN